MYTPAANSSASPAKNTATGPSTPPSVAISGFTAFAGGFRSPPGRHERVISTAAIPKKNTMNTSFTR